MTFKPLPFLTIFSIVALCILLMLGNWQWQRFVAKKDLPPVGTTELSAAVPLPAQLKPNDDFVAVRVEGVWASGTIGVYAVEDGVRGLRWFSPLVTDQGPILVDRGFAPDGTTLSDDDGAAALTGMMRRGVKPSTYTPDNAAPTYYWPDVPALLAALSQTQPTLMPAHYLAVASSDLAGTGRPRANPFAQSGGANLIAPERHLGYALTWWGLAGALIGVYLAFHASQGRLRFGRQQGGQA